MISRICTVRRGFSFIAEFYRNWVYVLSLEPIGIVEI